MGKEIGVWITIPVGDLQPMEDTPATPPGAIVNRNYYHHGLVMMKLMQGGIAVIPKAHPFSAGAESIETSLAKDSRGHEAEIQSEWEDGGCPYRDFYLQKISAGYLFIELILMILIKPNFFSRP
jgi:hypothetical protein